MEPVSIASVTLASILATLPVDGQPMSQSSITTTIRPAIAGQWEIDLSQSNTVSEQTNLAVKRDSLGSEVNVEKNPEPKVTAGKSDGVFIQTERRITAGSSTTRQLVEKSNRSMDKSGSNWQANNTQCRELYYFGADNEMWAISGAERTYGRYLVTHGEEGLPIIAIQTVFDNNEVDCSGNKVDQTDEALLAYLDHKDNKMQWCADAEGKDCFMTFTKVLP